VFRHDFESLCSEEFGILASHFHELPEPLLKECPVDFLSALLSHGDLKIKDEDSLLAFLSSLWTSNPAYFVLSEFIRFEFVSVDQITEFVESSFEFLGAFNSGIWRAIGHRLILPVRLDDVSSREIEKARVIAIPFEVDTPLQGIIGYLTKKCGGNVHEKGVVAITASSHNGNFQAYHLADLASDRFFNSMREPDQWFCYDFKDRRTALTHYSVRTYHSMDYNPRSWVVETSIDGENWTEVDRKVNCNDLHAVLAVRTFPLANQTEGRMVRFRQTDANYAQLQCLCLTAFEVFGTLHINGDT
jgi:hypothetical protein